MKRTSIVCIEVMLGIVLLTGILMVGTAWRLSQGPLSLQFLLPYAKEILQDDNSPVQVEVQDIFLTWAGWQRALDVRAENVSFRTVEGERLARIREVSVSLSFRALLQGVVAPTSLEVIRPRMLLVRSEAGDIEFGMTEADGDAAEDEASGENARGDRPSNLLPVLLDGLSGNPRAGSRLRFLDRITVVGGALRVQDQQLGITWGARQADFSIQREATGMSIPFDLELNLPRAPHLRGQLDYVKETHRVNAQVAFDGIDMAAVAKTLPALEPLSVLSAVVDGSLTIGIGFDGRIYNGDFSVASGPGSYLPSADGAARRNFKSAEIEGRLNRDPDQIQISRFAVEIDDSKVDGNAVLTRAGGVAAVNATARVDRLKVNDLGKYWPAGAADEARSWVLENIRGGEAGSAVANLTGRIGIKGDAAGDVAMDSINGNFSVENASIRYLDEMPQIRNVSATATFSSRRFDIAVHSGNIGDIKLAEGAVNIWNIGDEQEFLAVFAEAEGPVQETLALLAHPRLDLLSKVGLDTVGATGAHRTQLNIKFPLLVDLRASDVEVKATARIEGLGLNDVLKGADLSDGSLVLSVDNEGLKAEGSALYASVPIRFNWIENFRADQEFQREFSAGLILDQPLRQRFGADFPDVLEGPVSTRLIVREKQNGEGSLVANMDLAAATLKVPGFGWQKPPGAAGAAEIELSLLEDRLAAIPKFSVTAGDFSTTGSVVFATEDERFQSARIDRFALGETLFAARLDSRADGVLVASVKGTEFDARPFIEAARKDEEGGTLPAFSLAAGFDRVRVDDGPPATAAAITLERDKNAWRRIVMDVVLPGSKAASRLKLESGGAGDALSIDSPDAGRLFLLAGVTDAIRGGVFELRAIRIGGEGSPWNGAADTRDFRLAGAPRLARILTLASLTGISDVLNGKEGISFDRLVLPFEIRDELVTFADARAVGSELGITGSGKVDLGNDLLEIEGTLVPAYTINSLVGKIPVIGEILTGAKGGGLFAASYKVTGPVDKPDISVNALSTLAPGFLRKLLGQGRTPDESEIEIPDTP